MISIYYAENTSATVSLQTCYNHEYELSTRPPKMRSLKAQSTNISDLVLRSLSAIFG